MKKAILILMFIPFVFALEPGEYTQAQLDAIETDLLGIGSFNCDDLPDQSGFFFNEEGILEYWHVYTCLEVWAYQDYYMIAQNEKWATFSVPDFITCSGSYGFQYCADLSEDYLVTQMLEKLIETRDRIENFQTGGSYRYVMDYYRGISIFD